MFDGLNWLISAAADAGASGLIYQLWHIPNVISLMVFCFIHRKKYGIKKLPSLIIVAIIYALGYLWLLFIGWMESGFTSIGDNNIVKGFIYFPIFALIPANLFKIDKRKIWDFIAPCFPLLQCVAHLACNFAGCCRGYIVGYGIWNPVMKEYTFPIQLLESLVSLLVFIACLLYADKGKRSEGKVYPFFLITFGATRFFLEFFRDNHKIIFGISDLALHALLMAAVGGVWMIWVEHNNMLANSKAVYHKKSNRRK